MGAYGWLEAATLQFAVLTVNVYYPRGRRMPPRSRQKKHLAKANLARKLKQEPRLLITKRIDIVAPKHR